jgi:hypothetical protein
VLRVNTRFGALRPSHRRSLRSVYLDELSLSWTSGECEESCALSESRRAFGAIERWWQGQSEPLSLYVCRGGCHSPLARRLSVDAVRASGLAQWQTIGRHRPLTFQGSFSRRSNTRFSMPTAIWRKIILPRWPFFVYFRSTVTYPSTVENRLTRAYGAYGGLKWQA